MRLLKAGIDTTKPGRYQSPESLLAFLGHRDATAFWGGLARRRREISLGGVDRVGLWPIGAIREV